MIMENRKNSKIWFLMAINIFCTIVFSSTASRIGSIQIILLTVSKIVIVLTVGFGILFAIKKRGLIMPKYYLRPLLFVAYVMLIYFLKSFDYSISSLIVSILVYFVYVINIDDLDCFSMLIDWTIIGGYGLVAYYVYSYNGIGGLLRSLQYSPIDSVLVQRNILAFNMAITVLMCTYKILYLNKKGYFFLLILPIVITLGSGSRRGLITIIVAISILYILKNPNEKIVLNIIVAIVGILIAYQFIKHSNLTYLTTRIDSLLNVFSDNSNASASDQGRLDMIITGISMFTKKPIFGYGAGAFKNLAGYGIYSHNNYVELLVNFGIVGFGLYYSVIISCVIKLIKLINNGDDYARLLLAFWIMRLVSDIGNVSYYDRFTYIILAFSIAYVMLLKNENGGYYDEEERFEY